MTEPAIDTGEILEALNDKADRDAGNFSSEGKSTILAFFAPSDEYIELTLGDDGDTYTAPANGWFTVCRLSSATNQNLSLENTVNQIGACAYSSNSNQYLKATIPAMKGDVVACYYTSSGGTTQWFRFVYAEGEV